MSKMEIKSKLKSLGLLLKQAFINWKARDPFNSSSVIAYYTIFSLPGLLVIVINLAGYFFGHEAVTNQISGQISGIIGNKTAKDIQSMIAKASQSDGLTLSSIISFAVLLFGATGVFYQIQQILNKIWGVKPKPKQKIFKVVKDRVFSFGLILTIAFLLLVSLVLSSALSAVSNWVSIHLSESLLIVFRFLDFIVSLSVITVLFAAIFKFLPDVKIKWLDVWVGSLITSFLFVLAKFALGFYFGNSNPASAYGAAGSVILIMLWVTYAGLILLFGAEFTKVYATRGDKKIAPVESAELVESEDNK